MQMISSAHNKGVKFFTRGKILLILMIILILALRLGGDKGIVGYFLFCLPLAIFSLGSLGYFIFKKRGETYTVSDFVEILFYILTLLIFISVYILSNYGIYIIG